MAKDILYPTFALVALIFIVFGTMFVSRGRHMRASPPRGDTFDNGDSAMRYFQPVEMPANNYRNLFEAPVLYFALVPLLLVTGQAGPVQVVLAWTYVALRSVHSVIHIGPKKVGPRALAYVASMLVLVVMWGVFAVSMV